LYGADAMEVGLTRSILAECHRQQLRLVEAEAVARSSLEILRPFRGKQVDSDVHGQRVLRLMADRGRIGEAEKKSQEVYDELAGNANRPREAYAAAGLLLADFAAARGDTDRAGQLLAPHRNAIPGGSHIAHTSVLLRIARMELLLGNLTEAKQAVAAAKTLQRDRGLPIDFALGLAAIAAEVAAAEGQSESALAEYADFLKRFPMPKYSPATQLVLDMSKARVFTTLKRWSDAEALLRDWVGKALLPGQELPVSANGEALLLAGEAALNLGKPGAAKLLQAAGEILQKHDVVNSSRLVRLNAAMLRLGGSP
jgi:ATP/maltotriose-dependent transcriptional regulator MalT